MKQYYGIQTQMALENFPFPVPAASKELIYAIVEVKHATAKANAFAGNLDTIRCDAILQACNTILNGSFDSQFITSSVQGGAGTSIHMNVNEVIAGIANEILEKEGKSERVHANDHVNMSQSTNDVNPSALKIAAIRLAQSLIEEMVTLASEFRNQAEIHKGIMKLGRTHIQDAVPTTISAEFIAYASIIERDIKRINETIPYLQELNLGGTAIGNYINASPKYRAQVIKELSEITSIELRPLENAMSGTSSTGDFCHLMSVIYGAAVNLSKIATDIRFMASGPKGGIGEITLQALQPGSSIMPGKVNPVAAESMNQISFYIAGKNVTVHNATEQAHLELAVMFPVIADSLISSIKLLTSGISIFNAKCIATLQVNKEACEKHLEESMAYATLFTPKLGYDVVSKAVKKAVSENKTLREVLTQESIMEEEFNNCITSYEK